MLFFYFYYAHTHTIHKEYKKNDENILNEFFILLVSLPTRRRTENQLVTFKVIAHLMSDAELNRNIISMCTATKKEKTTLYFLAHDRQL